MKQMTDYQRELVTTNMSVVDHVIRAYIHVNNSALESYEDFYQIGSEALCKAAMSYNPATSAFSTYASRVVRNALIDHCRAMNTRQKLLADVDFEEWVNGSEFGNDAIVEDGFRRVEEAGVQKALNDCHAQYTGVIKLGVEALQLKSLGYTSKEIAEKYNTTTNNVNAWISKARFRLKSNPSLILTTK